MSSSNRTGVAVIASELVVRYRRGSDAVLDNLSVRIGDGETTAVIGPSGQGKSTLLYVVGLLLQPQGGHLSLGGSATSKWTDAQRSSFRASHVGFVFQDAALDPTRTSFENVIESLNYSGVHRRQARELALASLDRFGVSHLSGRAAANLSGGEAQRVGLARALAKMPGLVLADEPTGNLDPDNAEVVFGALRREASQGAAVMIVTHDHGLAARCDTTIRLGQAE